MTVPVLEIRSLHKQFGGDGWVIEDCSLTVAPGEVLYILGPSGSGKTTLLRLIAGFETPDRGEILQEGRTISRPGWIVPPERRNIGFVFQDYAIFPHLTVRENVGFGLTRPFYQKALAALGRAAGRAGAAAGESAISSSQADGRVRELLALSGLTGLENRYPDELSGGQQQRVALARAL
ncbi:MAG: ABC transporter ATP-binding protein, partial [bacterium]